MDTEMKKNADVAFVEEPLTKRCRKACNYLLSDKLLNYYEDHILPFSAPDSCVNQKSFLRSNDFLPHYNLRPYQLYTQNIPTETNDSTNRGNNITNLKKKQFSMVGNFKKEKQIGEGTYGSVFRGRAPQNFIVALKRIRCDDGLDYKCDLQAQQRQRLLQMQPIQSLDLAIDDDLPRISRLPLTNDASNTESQTLTEANAIQKSDSNSFKQNTKEFESFDFDRGRMAILKKKGFGDQIGIPHTAVQELQALERLNHKNIVNLIDCASNRSFSCIPVPEEIPSNRYLTLLTREWQQEKTKNASLQSKYPNIKIPPPPYKELSAEDCRREIAKIFNAIDEPDRVYIENCIRETIHTAFHRSHEHLARNGEKAPPLFFMIFEFMDRDLSWMINNHPQHFSDAQIKYYFQQIMAGLRHCHQCGIIHRDIKPNNILINQKGEVKLCDFGLAFQQYSTHTSSTKTNRVVTIWYRPLEVLMGDIKYSTAIDIWSVACIFLEMYLQNAPFQGRNEMDQFRQICALCGVPTEANYPGCSALPWHAKLVESLAFSDGDWNDRWVNLFCDRDRKTACIRRILSDPYLRHKCSQVALHFVDYMLVLDPLQRPTCDDILAHPYFVLSPPAKHTQINIGHLAADCQNSNANDENKD